MILDPTNEFINVIISHCDLSGKRVLEIGCGKGRLTRELACRVKHLVASDPDEAALAVAAASFSADNVEFVHCRGEDLDFPVASFDYVVYPLSLSITSRPTG